MLLDQSSKADALANVIHIRAIMTVSDLMIPPIYDASRRHSSHWSSIGSGRICVGSVLSSCVWHLGIRDFTRKTTRSSRIDTCAWRGNEKSIVGTSSLVGFLSS